MQDNISNLVEQFLLVFYISGKTLFGLIPYLLAGLFLGLLIRNLSWMDHLTNWCHKSSISSIFLAALLGVVSPLCTYGTVPFILILLKKKFPLAPLITFLIASSSLNPQLFFITIGGIHLEMAIARLITVILFSFLAGFIVRCIPSEKILVKDLSEGINIGNNISLHHSLDHSFKMEFKTMWKELKYIGFYILIGCIIGAAIQVFIPCNDLAEIFNAGSVGSILIATILGVPVYVCGGGTIPVIGSLLLKGMNIGAALSFLTVGQTVRITPLITLSSLIRIRYLILFVFYIILFGFIIGLSYDLIK